MFDNHCHFLCIAHRGASGHEPGNTLPAVQKALELGARAIELDIHYVHNKLLVTHDTVINDPVRGPVDIMQCSFETLRTLDVGKGQLIPTLEEVLNVISAKTYVNLELKGSGTAGPVCKLVRSYTKEKRWPEDRFILSSFDIKELETARSLCPDICLGLLIDNRGIDFVMLAARVRAKFIGMSLSITDPVIINTAHDNNLKVLVFTVNGEPGIRHIKTMGADGVFTDLPELCN